MSNQLYSYDMGFGGAGLIMSYPLAKLVQKNIEDCFRRHSYSHGADLLLMTCVNDFGVSLTAHQGLHQIYENIIPRSTLKTPLETFLPWAWDPNSSLLYIFTTRPLSNDSCATPHMFSFDSIKKINDNEVQTNYVRAASRELPTCGVAGNHSADSVSRIEVLSPLTKPNQNGRTECCDVVEITDGMEIAKIKLRDCKDDELIA
ncbi:hypothetical protein CTI12_AA314920 [Artemisia annua]|uniref:Uncharacterized protein n=1 Tax=Artemisia annua TaxID=35608 RepID=A0A2U1N271_ARTAN|nr:hypothetical protein CTI12_AA314920 [Artemisia annua]